MAVSRLSSIMEEYIRRQPSRVVLNYLKAKILPIRYSRDRRLKLERRDSSRLEFNLSEEYLANVIRATN